MLIDHAVILNRDAVRDIGLGETAPANLYHFVGYPAVAYTVEAH